MRQAIPVKIAIRPGQVLSTPGRDLTCQPSVEVNMPDLDGIPTPASVSSPDKVGESPCQHHSVDIRAFSCANGTVQFVKQCLVCGEKVGSALKKADVEAARGDLRFIAEFDEELREKMREANTRARRAYYESIQADRIAQFKATKAEESAHWHEWYAEYLTTPQWRHKRDLVMKRAGHVCEGCGTSAATEVHHLTYDHVGSELLFELVAVCRSCHGMAHGRDN